MLIYQIGMFFQNDNADCGFGITYATKGSPDDLSGLYQLANDAAVEFDDKEQILELLTAFGHYNRQHGELTTDMEAIALSVVIAAERDGIIPSDNFNGTIVMQLVDQASVTTA